MNIESSKLLTSPRAGSPGWRLQVVRRGTPWMEPADNGRWQVTFFWHHPQGCELTFNCQPVWVHINCLTDHHQPNPPQSLQRLNGTDVWYWQTELNGDWRGSYCFIPCFEGLDMPEVSLVAILDADKEGFLRSERSLIQTIGRTARNLNGKAILYGDRITDSMAKAIGETERRRIKQQAYNAENGIVLQGLNKKIGDILQLGQQPGKRYKGKGKSQASENAAQY